MFGVLVKDCSEIPDARGDKKKLHSIFQVKQERINIYFLIILKKDKITSYQRLCR